MVECEHKSQRTQGFFPTRQVGDVLPRLFRGTDTVEKEIIIFIFFKSKGAVTFIHDIQRNWFVVVIV